MNQTYSRCGPAEAWPVSMALKYETQTSGSAALSMALSSHSEHFCLLVLFGKLFNKPNMWHPLTLYIQISSSDIMLVQQPVWTLLASCPSSICIAWCKAPVTWANNMFWLSRVRVSSGRCCYVAGKNRPPVVMWARGLLGWRAKALRWDQFMEEDYV